VPENHVVVMRETRVRLPNGRVAVLTPGLKSERVSDKIRSILPKDKRGLLRAKGRIVEDRPPWAR